MTIVGLVCFVVGLFALRMFGGFGLSSLIGESENWNRLLTLLPMALVSAVVAIQVGTTNGELVLDARLIGIAIAAVLSKRGLPMGVVVVIAAAATAGTRALGWG
jgi:hypothetical protein